MKRAALFGLLALVGAGLFLAFSSAKGYVGFPLDDAWIHQTFARNLAWRGEWAFVPGQPSAGSTSPLWTALLAAGYWLRVEYHLWAYLLGILALALVAYLSGAIVFRWRRSPWAAVAAGAFVAFEWHMTWAAASGMETLLFCALILLVFDRVLSAGHDSNQTLKPFGFARIASQPWSKSFVTGLVIGLAILTRPDGLTLLPFAAAASLLTLKHRGAKPVALELLALGLGAGLLFAGYLAFNERLSGSLWPNTFYAKQAEYSVLRLEPYLGRLLRVATPPFAGSIITLVPGIALSAGEGARQRNLSRLLPLGWAVAYLALYAWRLPVTYQHGRYVMPVIPIVAVYGIDGLAGWLRLNDPRASRRILSRVWLASVVAVTLAFLVVGGRRYALDVAIIETEMVASARWLNQNTSPGALIAAHDIGAVGYFADRPVLDLAGLVSPEVIPVLRDEPALARLIVQAGADYFMTFPNWYPLLVADPRFAPIYDTHAPYSPLDGGENMHIYRVAPD